MGAERLRGRCSWRRGVGGGRECRREWRQQLARQVAPLCKFYGWRPGVVYDLDADELTALWDYMVGYGEGDTDIRYYD